MAETFTQEEIAAALQTCADEPVHMPGTIQPFGCLLIAGAETWIIDYASENTDSIIGHTPHTLFGQTLSDIFGDEVDHAIKGSLSKSGQAQSIHMLGYFEVNGRWCAVSAFQTGDRIALELEPSETEAPPGTSTMSTVSTLSREIEACKDEQTLLNRTVDLLRHITGYDRVKVYRFDAEWNGEVVAEAKRGSVSTMLGLRFPKWDIPDQARAIMLKISLRLIEDVNQAPVPILAARDGMPNIDITPAASRGVSPVHVQYLRNMDVSGTMTLSIKVKGALWGIIAFHHKRPRLPDTLTREVLRFFIPIFAAKLDAIIQARLMERVQNLDSVLIEHDSAVETDSDAIATMVPIAMDAFQASGIAIRFAQSIQTFGETPDQPLLSRILDDLAARQQDVVAIDSLPDLYPNDLTSLKATAGVLYCSIAAKRIMLIFRPEQAQNIQWAGSPAKDIRRVDDTLVLTPRASFAKLVDTVRGRSVAWSPDDLHFARHVRMFLNAAERQALAVRLAREQKLMIEELNHRIRNIIALVRSVSAQARRRYGTLNSYAAAMEQRIRALASTLEIERGDKVAAVRLQDMIAQELTPHSGENRLIIEGPDLFIHATVAPVVALVMHELITNAVKHGSLSTANGIVSLTIREDPAGYWLEWVERGGPLVGEPKRFGFGRALIEQAIPHELGGKAEHRLEPDGVNARFLVPFEHFADRDDAEVIAIEPVNPPASNAAEAYRKFIFPDGKSTLILEDNYIIAKEMFDLLEDFGCKSIEICSNAADALVLIEDEVPDFAVLDINLADKENSEAVAMALKAMGCPFIFVSGYRNKRRIHESLADVPLLAKPINEDEVEAALKDVFG